MTPTMTMQDITDRIGWKESPDIRGEVLELCRIISQLERRVAALEEETRR